MLDLERLGLCPCLSPLTRATVAVVLVATATVGCSRGAGDDVPFSLRPFASNRLPLSRSDDVALVSADVACILNSFESQIVCTDRRGHDVGVFGREGEGPGEFRGSPGLERGPDGMLAVFEIHSAQLSFFQPNGTLVSETRMPVDFFMSDLHAGRGLGYRLAMLDRTRSADQPDYVPMAVDAFSGEVIWERPDLVDSVGRDCFTGITGILNPKGGLVTTACGHELVFLSPFAVESASAVVAPNYVALPPSDRDVEAYLDRVTRIGGGSGFLSPAQKEAYAAEYRAEPRRWFLSQTSLAFDGENRLWAALTLDRDAFSYIEIWIGARYAATVRIRDRLLGFDILGSTLVALVEREPDQYGIAQRGIDWYDIAEIEFARDE